MSALTLEAIEETACRVRAGSWVSDAHVAALRERYASARATDESLGVLVAEAWVRHRMQRARDARELRWKSAPIALANEPAVPLGALENAVALERNGARRTALWDLACDRAQDHFSQSKAIVEALRERSVELGCATPEELLGALGLSANTGLGDALLEASDGAFDELDGWALREVELGERVIDARRKVLPFEARLRSLAQPRASACVALGDRSAGCARWLSRVGLDGAMGAVIDRTGASDPVSEGVALRVEREGERVVLTGSEPPSVWGAARIAGTVSEAVSASMDQAGPARERAGRDRLHRAVFFQLGERLLWSSAFVTRELGVDVSQAALVTRAALHGSLVALRRACAEGPFVRDALSARGELVVRLRDRLLRALGSATSPSWTVHVGADAIERRAEAQCFAAVCEAVLFDALRGRFDEDWFRNPRAGEALRAECAMMRGDGTVSWLIARTGAKDEREAIERGTRAFGVRLSEAFASATR